MNSWITCCIDFVGFCSGKFGLRESDGADQRPIYEVIRGGLKPFSIIEGSDIAELIDDRLISGGRSFKTVERRAHFVRIIGWL